MLSARRWLRATLALCVVTSVLVAAPQAGRSLRQAAGDRWLIGGAVSAEDLETPGMPELVLREFNTITVETALMPFKLAPERDRFVFEPADRVVAWAEQHGLPVFGHMLLWDYKTPQWLFQDSAGKPLPREQGLANLRFYIRTVMEHYRGRILAWNVVNEAISDEPGEYLRDTTARRSIGDDYVERAFAFAHEADPNVELYYNDYNVVIPEKRAKILKLVRSLRAQGRRVDTIGLQGHWMIGFPRLEWIDDTIEAFAAEGFKVRITEMDVDVLPRTVSGANMETVEHGPNPFPNEFPPAEQARLAARYGALFERLLRHPSVASITFWGSHDGRSWLNNFPVRGRTNHALLFDRQLQRKPAHTAVVEAFEAARRVREED